MQTIEFPRIKDYKNQAIRTLQAKLDGYLTKIYIDDHGLHVFTKNDKDITDKVKAIPHIKNALDRVPSDSALFGELHCPGVPATSVVTMLNDADEKLQLTVFAAPRIHDLDMSNVAITEINELLNSYGLDTPYTIELAWLTVLTEEYKEELLDTAVENKWEGWVLKEAHMQGWYKLKPVRTVDGFVIDTYASDSDSFPGGLKCIRIGIWKEDGTIRDLGTAGNGFQKPYRMQFMSQTEINTAREKYVTDFKSKHSGTLTEAQKFFFEETMKSFDLPRLERDILLNKVCEIAFDSVAAGGKLRFPRFCRWRDDKDRKDCTEDQLENKNRRK